MSSSAKKRPKVKARRSDGSHLRAAPLLFQEPPPSIFPSRNELLQVAAVIVIAASVAVTCHYVAGVIRHQPKPFCDSGEEPQEFCEPCPDHGECNSGRWECFHGYRKQGSKCVEDTEINKKVEELSKWVEDHICGSYAQRLCGGTGTIWFPEADILFDEHQFKERIGLENDAWILVHKKAVKTAESSLETRTASDGTKKLKCRDSVVEQHKPYLCRIRQWIYKSFPVLVAVLVLIIGSVWLLLRVHQKQYISSRAEQVYEQICEILEENALTSESMDNGGEPWVGFSWLRDHLLLPKERKNAILWKKVEELVQEDCRIDQYPKLIKGEPKIVLQWQGSVSSKIRAKATARRAKPSNYVDMLESDAMNKHATNPGMYNT
ncbi:hypothetical protein Taro_020771 [Colocasia esculenta]|uniref:Man1/Src1-like C-terminal domain-containing protein n=1 Tax=Colocasia esculenta TaxID=4460 RepID=A0A843UZN0_COLES|nr:hypothetical protein [Colocasia esculenta]